MHVLVWHLLIWWETWRLERAQRKLLAEARLNQLSNYHTPPLDHG